VLVHGIGAVLVRALFDVADAAGLPLALPGRTGGRRRGLGGVLLGEVRRVLLLRAGRGIDEHAGRAVARGRAVRVAGRGRRCVGAVRGRIRIRVAGDARADLGGRGRARVCARALGRAVRRIALVHACEPVRRRGGGDGGRRRGVREARRARCSSGGGKDGGGAGKGWMRGGGLALAGAAC
jgi:hypothetical protein